jgi:hypothetical protein
MSMILTLFALLGYLGLLLGIMCIIGMIGFFYHEDWNITEEISQNLQDTELGQQAQVINAGLFRYVRDTRRLFHLSLTSIAFSLAASWIICYFAGMHWHPFQTSFP